jgi:glycosyltransferase involved in cell wall biosynthesis
MRALVLVENLSVPADRRVWQECLTLTRAGWEVVVVCPQGSDRDREPFQVLDGVEIHRYRVRPATGGPVGYAREYASAFWHTCKLVLRLARRRRFDVVHACNPPDLLLLAAWPLRLRGTAFVFDHHDLVPELYLSRFARGKDLLYELTRVLERMTFALADVVISTNDSYRGIALRRGKKAPEDVFVVRNGPDLTRLRPSEPDPELRGGRAHLIAYVGVIAPQDGVDHALRALAALRERRDDWRAVFVGDGDALPELRALAHDLGLDDAVEFAGWQDDEGLRRVLSTADVCLSPEPHSPLNDASTMIKVAEYMAMGKPVVCYDLVESRATAGDAAVYARANDERALANEVDALLDEPARRAAMGAFGRARAEQALAWEHSEPALLAAYERAVTRRTRGWTRSRPSVSVLRTNGHGRRGGDETRETSTASSRTSASSTVSPPRTATAAAPSANRAD